MYGWDSHASMIIRYTNMANSNGNKNKRIMSTKWQQKQRNLAKKKQVQSSVISIIGISVNSNYMLILTELEKSILYFQEY